MKKILFIILLTIPLIFISCNKEEVEEVLPCLCETNGIGSVEYLSNDSSETINVFIPNSFTPNGDGWNDEFSFGEHGMQRTDVQIFNRWGQLVYSWNGQNKSWDGRGADNQDLPEAVYFYILKADGEDGYYYEEKGSITLVR